MEENNVKRKQTFWSKKTTGQKVSFIFGILVFVISLIGVFFWIYARDIFGQEAGDKILGEGVANGWVLIGKGLTSSYSSWLLTFFVIAVTFIFVFVANFLINLCTNRGRKSKTIGSLLKSLVKYISILAAIAVILAFWGVDIVGIVAGVGVLTLIIGLGCQSLIQDVISGLFIVFDDYFAVGDMVIIDGFRGVITEVGLKTTKLTDAGGNIKSITNNSIVSVVNLSRIDSMVTVKIGCAYEEDIVRVEGVIVGALEDIKKKIPMITDGPYYKGIDAINSSSIDFLILCRCKEANRFQVTRDLNRELILLFRENNILIPYNQISINKENDKNRPMASDVEKMLANKANNKNRGIKDEDEPVPSKGTKKSRLLKKAEKALIQTSEELEN